MTTPTNQSDSLYEQRFHASHQAFMQQGYEVAYHALTAAMHRARDINSLPLLHELLQEATTQENELERLHPTHILSSSSAHQRGNKSVYNSLTKQIETALLNLNFQDDLETLRKHGKDFLQI